MQQAASISMRCDGAVHFGSANHIALTLLVVESPGMLDKDQEVEFQMELPGLRDTVYGTAVVHHAEHFEDKLSSYELRILRLRAGDEILLREWVDDMRHGGSSAHPHRHLRESQISSVPSAAETYDADLPPGAISTWDARRTAAAGSSARGRRSIRAGLRRHLERAADLPEDPDPTDEITPIDIEITEP